MMGICVYVWAVVVALLVGQGNGKVEPLNFMPRQLQKYLNICHGSGDLSQQSGQLVFWTAINQYTARFTKAMPNMTPQQLSYFNQSLQEAFAPLYSPRGGLGKRKKRQAGRRIRKEIRAMTIGERRRYFRALNDLKQDTSLPPNVYDFLADFHSGTNNDRAHFGPAFLPWHRLYLWILEFFLRQHDPRVTIPYWASVLDNDMDDPTDSVIFSPAFYGTGVGEVNDGPFRTWPQINRDVSITRNVQGGQLYTYDGIERTVAQTRARDIMIPTAFPGSNSEMQHGAAHVFVGGNQMDLQVAARDPIFFSHHCFVDQIWERFKDNQRRNGIDPQSDYPFDENDQRFNPLHRPTGSAGFTNLAGANTWILEAGNLNVFSTFVAYEDVPSCETRCDNSQFLRCNDQLNPPRCVSLSRTELQGSGLLNELNLGNRKKRQTSLVGPSQISHISCPKKSFLNDVDIRHIGFSRMSAFQRQTAWAYIPVKIVSKRPYEYTKFNKYSLNSMAANNAQLGLENAFITPTVQKKYASCDKMQGSIGKISILGYGLNYKGYAEEYVVVDNRLGVSESIGYLPVKVPTSAEPTEVMIAAFDSCGRVCKPYCKRGLSGGMDSQFTGAVRVTSTQPLQYAYSYGDATLHVWDVPNVSACPEINYNNIQVSFFCDYSETWVWNSGASPMTSTGSAGVMNPTWNILFPTNNINMPQTGRVPQTLVVQPVRRRSRNQARGRKVGIRVSQGRNFNYLISSMSQLYPQSRG